ncbi:trans-4-hydroxy-L-proline dehydratase [Deferribacter abyssi]|uniref:trans-4-hydroxy-L-proline dehydratase n=1 Tax=Deferribacter abyssi TaxID=213806 RepID=UPI003C175060
MAVKTCALHFPTGEQYLERGSTDRVRRLRRKSIEAIEHISGERAKLITEFYKNNREVSIPIMRGKAIKYLMEKKTVYIDKDELIVGERGDKPKGTPTYPEVCCHTLEDLKLLNDREKVPYKVSEEVFELYKKEIIPFWKGRTIREKIYKEMDEAWMSAYKAGVFTEFMEQRAPGHTVLDDKIYRMGMKDFIAKIDDRINRLDFEKDPIALDKREQLVGMKYAAEGIIIYAKRHAAKLREFAKEENDPVKKEELLNLAEICEWVPENAPRTFHEALQYYWFVHLGVIIELNTWDAFNPGKLDRHLYPFYKKDIEEGKLTKEKAKELLECFWIKFNNQPAPPKVGVTAKESATYTDFAQINLGGLNEDGSDAVNELTYLILDVIEEMRLLQPSTSIHVSKKSSDKFIKKALHIIKTGFGQPSVFNADAVIQELLRQDKSLVDARNGGTSGCVEAGAFGKENYALTGYFNLVKVLEVTLYNGIDPLSGEKIGVETGDVNNFKSFEELMDAFKKQLEYFINVKIKGNLIIERIYARYLPSPFLSIFIDDCIEKGMDYNAGGARYNSLYIQGVGIGTITDSLSAIKYHVFENKRFTMAQLMEMLHKNFNGFERERLILWNKTPKYGNDDDYADSIMKEIFESFFSCVDGRATTKPGGKFRVNMLPTTCHVYFGEVCGATPDGRFAYEPLSEGISPVQGCDRNGPTAVIKSASKMDHLKTGGSLLNVKFTPSFMQTEKGIDAVCGLIKGYFAMDGHHIQFNVIDAETLKKAKKHPERYRDLIVRVAGYSDYFCDLNEKLQDEIIKRTEHETV